MHQPSTPSVLTDAKTFVERHPDRIALIFPHGSNTHGEVIYEKLTFGQLAKESDRLADGLGRFGIRRGMRVLFFVPPGADFIALTFALVKIGAIPVFIDPGMGRSALLHCIDEVEPEAMIAAPLAHVLRRLYWRYFKTVRYCVTVGRRWFWGGATLNGIRSQGQTDFPMVSAKEDDTFMIGFTTGSTGMPKGVVYQHKTVNAQIQAIRNCMDFREGDIVLQAFPPFALRDVAMGLTCVLPKMNPTKPSEVDPRNVVSAIKEFGVTHSFGSPAFWGRVGHYCFQHQKKLPSLRKIILAGAPVSPTILRELKAILNETAEVYTPYGATEALPLTSITGSEILEETAHLTDQGAGTCVGRALPGVIVRIVMISDDPIEEWNELIVLKPFGIGEIVIKGDVVTGEYFRRPHQTALSKIRDGDTFWHRMSDLGYLDHESRLWFCGRKNHRVVTRNKTLFSVQCEAIFNQHKAVSRSALVGVGEKGNQRPVIIIEPWVGKMPRNAREHQQFIDELLALGNQNDPTREIKDVLFHPKFPVDFRHNAKIIREELTIWAEKKIR